MSGGIAATGPLATVRRALLLLFVAVCAIALLWLAWIAAQIGWYRFQPPRETALMTQRIDEAHARNQGLALRYRWVPYARISPQLKRALIAAEDAKFVEHRGFDWQGIENALEKNRRKGQVVAGGSTITQQLAKNLFLSPARSYWRKAQEAVATVLLEAILPKQRIFELYLNVIEWGNGVFGAEAAAQRYFGVSAAALSAEQAARLAAMVPSPRLFERRPDSAYLAGRVATILARMPSAVVP
jgi:monofunctional biosynthetic peptidoglycan transglycosylase